MVLGVLGVMLANGGAVEAEYLVSSIVFSCVGVAFGELDFPGVEVAVGGGADLSGEGSTKGAGLGSLAWRERGS